MSKQMTALIIMDGFGINPAREGNAILAAGTPNLDRLLAKSKEQGAPDNVTVVLLQNL